jgi:hypothetical protein
MTFFSVFQLIPIPDIYPKNVHMHLSSAKLFVDPVLTLLLLPLQSNEKGLVNDG